MRLLEAGRGTAGRGQIVLVLIEEIPQRRLRRKRHRLHQRLDRHRHHLDGGRLLEPPEIVPPLGRRIAGEAGQEEPLHAAGGEHRSQGLEHVGLRHRHRAAAAAADDRLELLGANHIIGPLAEELVDGGIAHDHAIGLRLPGQEHRPHDVFLVVGQKPHPPRITPRGRDCIQQELVEHRPHRDAPHHVALADLAPGPTCHDRVGTGPARPHLEERRQHEKGQHGEDRHEHEEGTLVLAKNLERAGHGTA